MTTRFSVESTPHYNRLARKLAKQRPDFVDIQEEAINYDISKNAVFLLYCGLRREDTYR